MDASVLNKKMHAARVAIAAHAEHIAAATEQPFELPETCRDLKPNMGAPLDTQLLALAELTAAALGLLVGVFDKADD
jgi:hypothetical protein